jgi:anthranilate synthase/aminodeoxychorismate synthase-like glutamine amidotransferase
MILLLDNYDSFVHNLARYLQRLGQETKVVRSDAIDAAGVKRLAARAIVISPGPCTPSEAGCSVDVVRSFAGSVPLLGVCLGHQAIAAAFGGKIVRASEPVHGRASLISHSRQGLFANLPQPLRVGRYHSLVVDRASLPAELEVTAETADGMVMAMENSRLNVFGVQFHPESILTEHGYELLSNFLRLAGLAPALSPHLAAQERPPIAASTYTAPTQPVTF